MKIIFCSINVLVWIFALPVGAWDAASKDFVNTLSPGRISSIKKIVNIDHPKAQEDLQRKDREISALMQTLRDKERELEEMKARNRELKETLDARAQADTSPRAKEVSLLRRRIAEKLFQ